MVNHDPIKLAPHAAKDLAELNITKKVHVLETWLREGIPWEYSQDRELRDSNGNRVFVYIPNSLRSFNTWSIARYSDHTRQRLTYLGLITGNGTDTLNKYPELKLRASFLMQSLNKLGKAQMEQEAPYRVSALELEIKRLNAFIENQNRKILEFQRKNIILSRNLLVTEKREKGHFEELSRNYADAIEQNAKLRQELSILAKQLKNIHPLRDMNRER